MARLRRLESPVSLRVAAGLGSVLLHLGLFVLVFLSGGRRDGVAYDDTPIARLVFIEAPKADPQRGIAPTLPEPVVPAIDLRGMQDRPAISPPSLSPSGDEPHPNTDQEPVLADEADVADVLPLVEEIGPPGDVPPINDADPSPTIVMPRAVASALVQRIERLAEKTLKKAHRAVATWRQRGQEYNAVLVLEPARDGVDADRVVADISAEDRGRQLKTRIVLRRVPFSQFTEIVDAWDPMVQLHDDEVVGPMHINSEFNVLADSQATPALLGKVSTAAGGFHMLSTDPRRGAEVFPDGIQTRAGRIPLPGQRHLLKLSPRDANARVHEITADTRIRFFADGSYRWGDSESAAMQSREGPSDQPVYFLAAPDVTLYVQGVVAGRILVYSPQRIIIEGSLRYAHDPRDVPDSGDYLGLVCERDIVVAPPEVTGPGDIDIHAALFARRRFVVTDLDRAVPATLRIYGSLAARSITASEPRYAMKVEYDTRFERQRPPGFPSTNRFAAEEWDRRWTEEVEGDETPSR